MLLNGPICKAPILRNEEGDSNDTGLYCYDAEYNVAFKSRPSHCILYKQSASLRVISGKAGE